MPFRILYKLWQLINKTVNYDMEFKIKISNEMIISPILRQTA